MRIVIVALGSFIVGAVVMSLLGSHMSTLEHSASAQVVTYMDTGTASIPVVPPLSGLKADRPTLNGVAVNLDGTQNVGGIYKNVTFRYGGGAYSMENVTILLPVKIELMGAAQNTEVFLASMGLIGCPAVAPQKPINPNTNRMEAALKVSYKGNLVSPLKR